ncbi:hypothetical protein PMIN05_005792 [Paraphaeosphaeria minitans]
MLLSRACLHRISVNRRRAQGSVPWSTYDDDAILHKCLSLLHRRPLPSPSNIVWSTLNLSFVKVNVPHALSDSGGTRNHVTSGMSISSYFGRQIRRPAPIFRLPSPEIAVQINLSTIWLLVDSSLSSKSA